MQIIIFNPLKVKYVYKIFCKEVLYKRRLDGEEFKAQLNKKWYFDLVGYHKNLLYERMGIA